jgi:hypothetical protein
MAWSTFCNQGIQLAASRGAVTPVKNGGQSCSRCWQACALDARGPTYELAHGPKHHISYGNRTNNADMYIEGEQSMNYLQI